MHAARRRTVGGAARPVGAVGEQGFECVAVLRAMRGSGACVVRYHRDPAQAAAMRRDRLGVSGLGDGGNRAAVARKVFHFRRCGAGVGGDGDGAKFDAGEPGQHRLDAIVEMNQHVVAGSYAARDEACCQRADAVVEFTVTPSTRRGVERCPDQKRMVAAGLGAHPQQPWHVEAREGPDKRPAAVSLASHPSARLFFLSWPGLSRPSTSFLAAILLRRGCPGQARA